MKKFLFTLLTLFMASSAFAEGGNYFYMARFGTEAELEEFVSFVQTQA